MCQVILQAWKASPELMSRGDSALLVVDVQDKLIGLIPGHERIVWNIRRAANHNIWDFSARVLATLGVGGQEMAKSWEKYRGHTIRNDGLSDDWSTIQAVRAY